MKRNVGKLLYWSPRILCIVFALFLSLFSLDVFSEGSGFWRTILALLIHLVPVYFVIIALLIAWRWEWIGAILFMGLAVLYILFFWGKFAPGVYIAISGPLFLVGILFLFNWKSKKK
ncbi:hypothetical protein ACFLYK_03885 [Candidatus Cloacimonadota bacterium]